MRLRVNPKSCDLRLSLSIGCINADLQVNAALKIHFSCLGSLNQITGSTTLIPKLRSRDIFLRNLPFVQYQSFSTILLSPQILKLLPPHKK